MNQTEEADSRASHLGPLRTANILVLASRALDIEAKAVASAQQALGEGFASAVRVMLACTGRVVVTGMGKSGHVGRKIAATLASTGTPALFMHPAEASHGDLGMITAHDVLLTLSNSGESDELNVILPVIKRLGVRLVAITGRGDSSLARVADAVIDSAVEQEACPLNLAPTASTTVQMALGDALAVALLQLRGFKPEDFARSHPGGALGRRLLVHVADLMRTAVALPVITAQVSLIETLQVMTSKGLGFVVSLDEEQRPVGIFTDGDLRRLIEAGHDLRVLRAHEVMRPNPRTVPSEALAALAATIMEEQQITSILAVDAQGRLVGALNLNDLLRAKVI